MLNEIRNVDEWRKHSLHTQKPVLVGLPKTQGSQLAGVNVIQICFKREETV